MTNRVTFAAAGLLLLSACETSNGTTDGSYISSSSIDTTYSSVASVKNYSSANGPKTGSRTGITVPVSYDDSYSAAATKASAHCGQWSLEAGSPKLTNGGSALAYTCQ